MMKRILFFDIDGTLAIPGQEPSKETVDAIRAARANGHKAILCTGRTEHNVPDSVRKIGFDGGIYSAGGRIIVDGKTISNRAMPRDMVEMIVSALQKEQSTFTLECLNKNYVGGADLRMLESLDVTNSNSELQRMLAGFDQSPFAEYDNEPVYKVSFLATSREQIDRIAGSLDDRVKVVTFDNLRPDFPLLAGEVSDKHIHKGMALQCVCDCFGVSSELSVAFGDSMNDEEMLLTAGIGVAMGNSVEQVKALANQVCESCADNGVAKTLIRLGLTDSVPPRSAAAASS